MPPRRKPPPQRLVDVVKVGDHAASLVALRDHLAEAVQSCDSMRDLAALSARLADVLERIESSPTKAEVSPADEVAQRRAARRAGANRKARTKRSG